MQSDLAQDAIDAALSADWQKALFINQEILKTSPSDINALNRMGRAYAELGNMQKARECVQEVLKLDPFNSIAQKALDRWKGLKNGEALISGPISSHMFLEEPGKTKIISLVHIGSPDTLAEINAGDEVKFNSNAHKVTVTSSNGKHVGRLPDDLSARIRKLVSLGYEYKIFIKSVDKNEVKVFIREMKRPTKLSDIPSFTSERINYVSYTPRELLQQDDDPQEDEEEIPVEE